MYNPIEEKRRFVQAQIQKSFNSGINVDEEIELEKAHKDGDHHPTKPWVWVSSANGGKGDWRVEGGRSHKKAGAGTSETAIGSKVDISKIPDAEFKRITQMLEKKNPDHSDAPRHLEEEAMSDKELKNFHAVAEHFKNSSKINKLTQEYCRKWAELAKQEMQSRNKKSSTADTVSQKDSVTSKEFSKNKAIVGEMLKDCDSKIDSNGVKKYHCKFYALGKDRSSSWLKQSDIEAYLRNYNDAKVTAIKSEQSSTTPTPRKPGSTNEIERMTPTAVHNAILGLNNTGTNVKDKGDHFLIEFDHNDFTTHGQRSPKIDRIAKFLESMGASCVIGKNEIKAYKKVEAKKDSPATKKHLTKDDMKKFVRKITKYTTLVRGDENDFYADIQCDTDKKSDSVERQAKQAGYTTKRIQGGKYVRISVDKRDEIAQDAGFKDYEEMKGYQDYVTQKNLLKKKSTSAGMRLLYQQDIDKYERDHADLIKRIGKK